MRAARLTLAVATVAGALVLAPAALATKQTWQVGAASVDISPVPWTAASDAAAFPLCDLAKLDGPRVFQDEEPYQDVNGNGHWDITNVTNGDTPDPANVVSEPYCDANANGRRDTLFNSGQIAQELTTIHDPIYARAIAVRDPQGHTTLMAEVTSQGLFSNVTGAIRAVVLATPGISADTGIVVGATHNESSPDQIGIYGAPDVGGLFGAISGIDDYYTARLVSETAQALTAAYATLAEGRLQVVDTRVPATVRQNLSNTFTTTGDDGKPVAVDPDLRVLRATRLDGSGVFTLLNVAAHNQEIGHGSNPGEVSDDWPGYFDRRVESRLGGLGLFMPSDIGSMEDVVAPDAQGQDQEGTFGQAQRTGETLADFVVSQVADAGEVPVGTVKTLRTVYDTPLENNLFRGAAAAGLFGPRSLYTGGQATGRVGSDLRTEVSVVDLGPDVQIVGWPGETFPAVSLGSRWGFEDASCPARANPPVPLWHAHAAHRFQMGLAGDMIGYLEEPWGWATDAGLIADSCYTDPNTGRDPAGHKHKLESESVGPQSAADAATQLTALLDQDGMDPAATIAHGRFLTADGTVTREATHAVAVWLATSPGDTALIPGQGTLIALPGITAFGTTAVTGNGHPIDGNGREVAVGDLQTRGFAQTDASGAVVHRWYADEYPVLTATSPGACGGAQRQVPSGRCRGRSGPAMSSEMARAVMGRA